MSESVRPHRRQPTRLLRPWDSPGKNTGVGGPFLLQCMKVKSESEVTQSCPTLLDPMDCSPPGSSIHGILQARVLEWGAIAFSRHKPIPALFHIYRTSTLPQARYLINLSSQTLIKCTKLTEDSTLYRVGTLIWMKQCKLILTRKTTRIS